MAKEREEHKSGGKKKLHLAAMTHHFMEDGSIVHEHHYKDHKDSPHTHPPRMVGTSQTLEDAQQHLADHYPGGDGEGGGEPEPNQGAQPAADQQAQDPDAEPGGEPEEA